MDLAIIKLINKNSSQEFFDNIETIMSIFGEADSIRIHRGEAELGWYRSVPDRMLEITVYENDNVDFWYERCTFGEDGEEDVDTGEVGHSLRSLQEWLEYGP